MCRAYEPFDRRFFHLFNSYYESLGPRHPRPQRGLLTRPGLPEVHAYRAHVDAAMQRLIGDAGEAAWEAAAPLVELGLNHEQQHQELILTDILHALSCNPLLPAYHPVHAPALRLASVAAPLHWIAMPGGTVHIGHGGEGFAFDNETPRHRRAAGALPHRRPAGDLRRVRAVHRRRRLRAARAVAVRWLGRRAGGRLASARLLDRAR